MSQTKGTKHVSQNNVVLITRKHCLYPQQEIKLAIYFDWCHVWGCNYTEEA